MRSALQADPARKAKSKQAVRADAEPLVNSLPLGHTGDVPVWCAHDSLIDTLKAVPHPRNPNKHPDRQIKLLARIIRAQGWRAPIVISTRSGFIVSGHARASAANLLGLETVPVNYQHFGTDAEELEHLVADNKIAELAELDLSGIGEIMHELKGLNADLTLTGFSEKETAKLLKGMGGALGDEGIGLTSIEEASTDLGGAMQLKEDMFFDSDLSFGIPPLRSDMLLSLELDKTYGLWMGRRDTKSVFDRWLYTWGGDSSVGLDLSKAIINFYTEDYKFECFWYAAREYATRIITSRVIGAITCNYSVWEAWPQALRIYNVYRSRWLGRYWQEAGIKIIPDIDFGSSADIDLVVQGIPKNAPCLSTQLHAGLHTVEASIDIKRSLKRVVDELKPQSLLLYVNAGYESIIENVLPKSLPFVAVLSRHVRMKDLPKNPIGPVVKRGGE
jgi:hypothetical protein